MRARKMIFTIGLVFLISGSPVKAGESDRQISLELGYGAIKGASSYHGGGLGVSYERGMSDLVPVYFHASIGGGVANGLSYWGLGIIGLRFLISDASKYVLHTTLGFGGGVEKIDGGEIAFFPRVETGLGIDFLQSRTFGWGIFLRAQIAIPYDVHQNALLNIGVAGRWSWGDF